MADVSVIGSSKSVDDDDDSFCSSLFSLLLALDHGPAVRAAMRPILSRCAAVLGANVSYDGEEYDCCCFFVGGAAEFLLEDMDPAVARVVLKDEVLFAVAPRLFRLDIMGGGDNGLEELIVSISP
jgi:hypothetical protein